MALKFVKTAVRRRIPRKSVMLLAEKPRRIVQDYAVDDFGDVPARKRAAGKTARDRGHALMPWHRRSNDPAGRWNAYCTTCNRLAVVCTEPVAGFDVVYGKALTEDCGGVDVEALLD